MHNASKDKEFTYHRSKYVLSNDVIQRMLLYSTAYDTRMAYLDLYRYRVFVVSWKILKFDLSIAFKIQIWN